MSYFILYKVFLILMVTSTTHGEAYFYTNSSSDLVMVIQALHLLWRK